ncbi:DUF1761 domain-containing protein [Jannaschia sp. M317]|uniref:DUF1761 domain-containing protein n=1 Tax=Jannaschia sp. M317 TaxID=2867011 RepID=UPI0021A38C75|nr:DUF1761 domain-containing protein [Jannaschia sp. M317]UWQ16550.1 DUF1761 domain-containing protein [Jannaschia sp. M317]
MGFLAVIAAAVTAWIWGAVWYGIIAKPWMAASGLTEDTVNRKDPKPYIGSFVCAVIVAGMLRHVLASSGIDNVGGGMITGLGLGLFVAVPWMATNVMFGQRSWSLIWMDGAYPAVGMALMGAVLMLL